ncbi:MAG: hypothetical protein IT384_19280 [Deltaproteobacteria bacterium]|nr:hypothetical protein [Deltaproteobacteria bacterium]
MDGTTYDNYHPLAERLWASILVDEQGRHELPPALEKAAYVVMKRIATAKELAWLYGSVYSLYAAMMRQGEKDTADALLRIALKARKLALEVADSWKRVEPPPPGAPPILRPSAGPTEGEPAFSMLAVQPRRA